MGPVLAIVGPTAIGKSGVALALAERLGGEIVAADSRQVYRYLDIGTAKPTAQERARVPHHLVDVAAPDEAFTLAHYRSLALAAIRDILQRGKTPILVGGSGLYVRAVVEGLAVPAVPPDADFRRALEARAAAEGPLVLHRELAAVDLDAAARIDPRNIRRVVRALEVWRSTGVSFSALQQQRQPPFPVIKVGLTADRDLLYRKIDGRIDWMVKAGLVEEVRGLVAGGYGWDLPALSGIGYRQIGEYLRGECDLEEAVQKAKYATHRFARQQYAWFRLADPDIRWFDVAAGQGTVVDTLARELAPRVMR